MIIWNYISYITNEGAVQCLPINTLMIPAWKCMYLSKTGTPIARLLWIVYSGGSCN